MLTETPAENGETVDAQVLERTVARFREAGIALPTFAQLADPDADPADDHRAGSPASTPTRAHPLQPLPRPLVQRRGPHRARRRSPSTSCCPRELTGVDAHDRRRARRPLPDDRARTRCSRRTGASRRALVTGAVRPDAQPRRLALDRQLLPRRRRDLAAHGLPRRRRAPRGDEPRALRLARALGRRPGGHHPHARHREQRQGDLRPVRTSSRRDPEQRDLQPVLRVREPPRPLPVHRRALGAVFETLRARRAGAAAARVRLGDRLGRHDRRRRLPEGAVRRR